MPMQQNDIVEVNALLHLTTGGEGVGDLRFLELRLAETTKN